MGKIYEQLEQKKIMQATVKQEFIFFEKGDVVELELIQNAMVSVTNDLWYEELNLDTQDEYDEYFDTVIVEVIGGAQ